MLGYARTPDNALYGVLGLAQHGKGRYALYGDSNCLDSSHQTSKCFSFLQSLLKWVSEVPEPYTSTLSSSKLSTNKNRQESMLLGPMELYLMLKPCEGNQVVEFNRSCKHPELFLSQAGVAGLTRGV